MESVATVNFSQSGYKISRQQALEAAQQIDAGKSLLAVARDLKYNHCTLRYALKRYGLFKPCRDGDRRAGPRFKVTPEMAHQAAMQIASGKKFEDAAAGIGVSDCTLRSALEMYGLRFRHESPQAVKRRLDARKLTPEIVREAAKKIASGYSFLHAANDLGVCKEALLAALEANGLRFRNEPTSVIWRRLNAH